MTRSHLYFLMSLLLAMSCGKDAAMSPTPVTTVTYETRSFTYDYFDTFDGYRYEEDIRSTSGSLLLTLASDNTWAATSVDGYFGYLAWRTPADSGATTVTLWGAGVTQYGTYSVSNGSVVLRSSVNTWLNAFFGASSYFAQMDMAPDSIDYVFGTTRPQVTWRAWVEFDRSVP